MDQPNRPPSSGPVRRATIRRLGGLSLAAAVPALAAITAARAQDAAWPQRTLKIVVPYAAGASTDNVARRLAVTLSERFGQGVVVENRTGAAGAIGTTYVMREPPDGHTLLAHGPEFMMVPQLAKTPPYEPDDLTPVGAVVFAPLGIVVNASSPYRTIQDLVAAAKASPGKISYGSGGEGTTPHLGSEQFARVAGVQLYHVPYKGAADAVVGLLGGQIDMQVVTPTTALPHLKSGRLRMVAISGDQRIRILPEVPTFAESGLKGVGITNWIGFWAPKGTPAPVLERWRREIGAVMATPDMVAYCDNLGALPKAALGDEFVRLIADESARLKTLAEQIGLQKK
ncbi:MAG: tripartite tricarboxylate transporter substrate binding protein [Burkholderiaceae bacterium]